MPSHAGRQLLCREVAASHFVPHLQQELGGIIQEPVTIHPRELLTLKIDAPF